MSEEKNAEKPESQVDEFARQTGAKKVGHSIPENSETPIDFSSIGGVCVLKPSDHPLLRAKLELKEDDNG